MRERELNKISFILNMQLLAVQLDIPFLDIFQDAFNLEGSVNSVNIRANFSFPILTILSLISNAYCNLL